MASHHALDLRWSAYASQRAHSADPQPRLGGGVSNRGDADGAKGAPHTAQNARQYALYFDLGTCNGEAGHGGVRYARGLAAHISNSGGATPGHPYCVTAACDPRPLVASDWHCVANVYDGQSIHAYVNGTLGTNGAVNPYPYPGGVYSPEAANRSSAGAEFGVGVSMSFGVNQYMGLLGGLVVYNESLTAAQVMQVCDWPRLLKTGEGLR